MRTYLFPALFATLVPCAVMAAAGSAPVRIAIDLDAAPWKFSPVGSKDLAEGRPQKVWGTDFPRVIDIDLGVSRPVGLFIHHFQNPEAVRVNYTLEGTNDGKHWTVLADKSVGKVPDGETAGHTETADFATTGSTVGMVRKAADSFFTAKIGGSWRSFRLKIFRCTDAGGKPVLPQGNRFHAYLSDVDGDELAPVAPAFDDSGWDSVGVPHCPNENHTYLNFHYGLGFQNKNGGEGAAKRGTFWYRTHFRADEAMLAKKVYLEFKSLSLGGAVYVNGRFKPGVGDVRQPAQVTHVGEELPFLLDVTDDLRAGDNVLAVRVSNAQGSFFTWPGFATNEGLFSSLGGINAPVRLLVVGRVHIPPDNFAAGSHPGSCFATIEASEKEARVRMRTEVKNADTQPHEVRLTATLVSPDGSEVLRREEIRKFAAGEAALFDFSGDIARPLLWFPANSPYGRPELYELVRTVRSDGVVTDVTRTKVGLRTITWDDDHCFINGKMHLLRGFGHRNGYPALGSAVPDELQWKDILAITRCGGNALRVGHLPPPPATVEACDTLGVLILMNSGDDEWALHGEPACTYKRDYDREMMLAYRSRPSVVVWESNNGLPTAKDAYRHTTTAAIAQEWDPLAPRIVLTRDRCEPGYDRKRDGRVVIGYTNGYAKVPGLPSINAEVYGANWSGRPCWNIARFDYANEKAFSQWFVDDYLRDIGKGRACGWIDWMLEETQGEGYTIYLDGKRAQKSLGSCAMDANRFPKLKYRIYEKALWKDFATSPGVALQSLWAPSGAQDVDAWSNCPQVELFLDGESLGIRNPNPDTKRCTWKNVAGHPGTLLAAGLDASGRRVCEERRVTAGEPARITLAVEPRATGPDNEPFPLRANGSDVAIVTATVVDAAGNPCPQAGNNITFEVSGEGRWRGSSNFLVTDGKPVGYHAPGDTELAAEGGLMRGAVRTTFSPGRIVVKATSPGLLSGEVAFESSPARPAAAAR